MSKFTTELRWICESFVPESSWKGEYEHSGYDDIVLALQFGYVRIFDFDFPIWDNSYREHLCVLIMLHFYTREIAYETYALWKLHLRERLVAIMPKYNMLYKQEALANPFDNIKHKAVGNDTSHTEDNGTTHGSSNGTGWNKYNETPQGGVTGLDTDKYLTNATKTTSDSVTDGTAENTQDAKHDSVYEYTGRNGGDAYYAEMTKMYKNYESVDNMVLHELEDLFFGLWE